MKVTVVLPSRVAAERDGVEFVSVEGEEGSVGIYPRRLDFVSALVPGVLTLRWNDGGEEYAAVDRGLLVKEGEEVTIAVRRGVMGRDLHALQTMVEEEYRVLDEREKEARSALAALEARFARRFLEQERRRRR